MKNAAISAWISVLLLTSVFSETPPKKEGKEPEVQSSPYADIDARWRGLKEIEAALIRFKTTYGRYPSEEEGISILCVAPKAWKDKKGWKPFLEPESLIDGWGNPFQYRIQPPGKVLGVYSTGEDGRSASKGEDDDDVNTWSIEEKNRFSGNVGPQFSVK